MCLCRWMTGPRDCTYSRAGVPSEPNKPWDRVKREVDGKWERAAFCNERAYQVGAVNRGGIPSVKAEHGTLQPREEALRAGDRDLLHLVKVFEEAFDPHGAVVL